MMAGVDDDAGGEARDMILTRARCLDTSSFFHQWLSW